MVLCLTQWGNKSAVLSAPGVRLSSVYSRLMGRASVWGLPGVRDSQSNPIQSFWCVVCVVPQSTTPQSAVVSAVSVSTLYIYLYTVG